MKKFLLSHRLLPSMINATYLENRINVFILRRQILFESEKNFNEQNTSTNKLAIFFIFNIKILFLKEINQFV